MHFSIDRTVHTTAFDKPVVDHWLERKIAQTAAGSTEKDRSDDRPLQRRARYRLSYVPLTRYGLEPVPRREHSTYQPICRCHSLTLPCWFEVDYIVKYQVRSGQVRSVCLKCTFRASCCSARLSREQVPAFAGSLYKKKRGRGWVGGGGYE